MVIILVLNRIIKDTFIDKYMHFFKFLMLTLYKTQGRRLPKAVAVRALGVRSAVYVAMCER